MAQQDKDRNRIGSADPGLGTGMATGTDVSAAQRTEREPQQRSSSYYDRAMKRINQREQGRRQQGGQGEFSGNHGWNGVQNQQQGGQNCQGGQGEFSGNHGWNGVQNQPYGQPSYGHDGYGQPWQPPYEQDGYGQQYGQGWGHERGRYNR